MKAPAPERYPHRVTWSVFVVLLLIAILFVTGTAANPSNALLSVGTRSMAGILAGGSVVLRALAGIGREPAAAAASIESNVRHLHDRISHRDVSMDRDAHVCFSQARGRIGIHHDKGILSQSRNGNHLAAGGRGQPADENRGRFAPFEHEGVGLRR